MRIPIIFVQSHSVGRYASLGEVLSADAREGGGHALKCLRGVIMKKRIASCLCSFCPRVKVLCHVRVARKRRKYLSLQSSYSSLSLYLSISVSLSLFFSLSLSHSLSLSLSLSLFLPLSLSHSLSLSFFFSLR